MIGGTEAASPIAPVDLAQAAIGPGMAVFSKYKAILEADGKPMSVHNALILINKSIDEYFSDAESDMGNDTRFCVDWFQQYGFKPGPFGEADVLARAKGTSVEGVAEAGVLDSKAGKVRRLKVTEYPADWDPKTDDRIPIWEALSIFFFIAVIDLYWVITLAFVGSFFQEYELGGIQLKNFVWLITSIAFLILALNILFWRSPLFKNLEKKNWFLN